MTVLQTNDIQILNQYQADYVIGVDEAGRGPLAGPVVASAVAMSMAELDQEYPKDHPFFHVRDSKKVTEKRRITIKDHMSHPGQDLIIGSYAVSAPMIDQMNILEATKMAWQESVEQCLSQISPEASVIILIDGNIIYPDDLYPIIPVTKGDNIHWTIALASIHAKVTRDTWMYEQSSLYPEYQFERHKGYGTQIHQEAIKTYGLSALHRKSFCTKIVL